MKSLRDKLRTTLWVFVAVLLLLASVKSSMANSITYNQAEGRIYIIHSAGHCGENEDLRCTFNDIYQVDEGDDSWNCTKRTSPPYQYEISCPITVGNGRITTYFGDTNKQILFNISSTFFPKVIHAMNASHVKFGRIYDETQHITYDGVDFTFTGGILPYWVWADGGSEVEFYSSNIKSAGALSVLNHTGGKATIWNSILDNTDSMSGLST